jgi:hypothetical protein
LSIDYLPPLLERPMKLVVKRLVDQLVNDPFDVVALENEDDLVGGNVDAVANNSRVREVKGRASSDELGGALLISFLQVRDDRYAFHLSPLMTATIGARLLVALHPMLITATFSSHRVMAPSQREISVAYCADEV